MNQSTGTVNENNLDGAKLAFVGCGVMGEAMIAGLIRKGVYPHQIVASHPRPDRRNELADRHEIRVVEQNAAAVKEIRDSESPIVVLCVKPQRLANVLADIKSAVTEHQLVISIVAGATIEKLSRELGTNRIVRAMPNTPAQIGCGMTAWTHSDVDHSQRVQVQQLLSALGKELFVETENMIDMATSLSATGPTYIFMMMEALIDAGVHMGFSRDVAKELVQETMLGSTQFAVQSHKHPAELRNMVTSPGGTSAAAIYEMEKGSLRTVLSKAVYAAYKRSIELGG